MAELTVERVYSEALFDAADELDKVDAFRGDLKELCGIFADNPEFFQLLCTPALSAEEKKSSALAVFEGRIPVPLLNFLCILVDKRRIGCFFGIVGSFERLADEKKGLSKGMAVSAVPLTEAQLQSLEAEAGKLFSRNVKLENQVDPSVLGGVQLYLDGKLIDASIRKKLDDLKERIV